MKRSVLASNVLALLMVVSLPVSARAGLITPLEGSAMIQGTMGDSDFYLLTQFFGYVPGQTVNYVSTIDTTSQTWAATLTGTYAGTPLSVTYSGDYSAFESGPITWTSSGTYGSNAWSGSGSALITEDSATTFHIDFLSTLTVGANTGSFDDVIQGSISPDVLEYTDTTGTLTINGDESKKTVKHTQTYNEKTNTLYTDVEENGVEVITDESSLSVDEHPPGRGREENAIRTIPEPCTFLLFGIGIACMASHRRVCPLRKI